VKLYKVLGVCMLVLCALFTMSVVSAAKDKGDDSGDSPSESASDNGNNSDNSGSENNNSESDDKKDKEDKPDHENNGNGNDNGNQGNSDQPEQGDDDQDEDADAELVPEEPEIVDVIEVEIEGDETGSESDEDDETEVDGVEVIATSTGNVDFDDVIILDIDLDGDDENSEDSEENTPEIQGFFFRQHESLDPLVISLVCPEEGADELTWRVYNPNEETVSYAWNNFFFDGGLDSLSSGQTDEFTVDRRNPNALNKFRVTSIQINQSMVKTYGNSIGNCVPAVEEPPVETTGVLRIIKNIINQNESLVVNPSDFSITVTGEDYTSATPGNGQGTDLTLLPGGYVITEENATYTFNQSFSEGCEGGNASVVAGLTFTCVITNTITGVVENPEEPTTPTEESESSDDSDNNRRDGHRNNRGGGSVLGLSFGEVLGVSMCPDGINSYIREGKKNDSDEVKKLQEFLNEEMDLKLEVNGVYDAETIKAVKAFQLKYADKILTPWGINEPTGYAYKLTIWWANAIICGTEDTAVMPHI
jgi:hypothetical protein